MQTSSSPNPAYPLPLSDVTTPDSALTSIADAQGNYVTPPHSSNWFARLWPSAYFYTAFIYQVVRSSIRAQRGQYDDARWYQSSLDVLRALETIGARIHISGLDIVNAVPGPCVFVANHMSTLETIFLPGIVQPYKDCTFVIKRALIEMPVFKHIMRARNPIVVDRVNPREDLMRVLKEGAALLESGRSIIVFPQTTRTTSFDSAQFNSIGVKLARDAGVPIIPVAVRSDAWGNGKRIKEFGKLDPSLPVHFVFGHPVTVEGRGNAAHAAVVAFIAQHLSDWGFAVDAGRPAQP